MRHTSAKEWQENFTRVLKAIKADKETVFQGFVMGAYHDQDELLSGTTSQAQLNRENNPYGRDFTNPKGKRRARRKLLPINKQTGRLYNARYIRIDREKENLITAYVGVYNRESYFKYVLARDGTSKMKARGLRKELKRRGRARKLGAREYFKGLQDI